MTPIPAYDERMISLTEKRPTRSRGGPGWMRAMGWSVGAIGIAGAVAGLVMLAQSRAVREMLRDMAEAWREGRRSARREALSAQPQAMRTLPARPGLQMLHDAILGNSKEAVAAVFGPPPTAVTPEGSSSGRAPSYWQADTWYYPLDPREKRAMAVRFERGVAKDVEFIHA